MQLSRQPSEPLYLELAQVLRGELRHYRIGDFLPGEMQLARRFAVNRHTLRRAVDELINEGRLLRRQGKGTQVLQRPLVYPLQADSAYRDALAALGVRTEARLLERRRLSASAEEARHLQLAEGAALIELSTLRLLDGELRWDDASVAPPRTWDREPEASAWRRWTARAVGWLPIESQL